jgi:hypothetical protein
MRKMLCPYPGTYSVALSTGPIKEAVSNRRSKKLRIIIKMQISN